MGINCEEFSALMMEYRIALSTAPRNEAVCDAYNNVCTYIDATLAEKDAEIMRLKSMSANEPNEPENIPFDLDRATAEKTIQAAHQGIFVDVHFVGMSRANIPVVQDVHSIRMREMMPSSLRMKPKHVREMWVQAYTIANDPSGFLYCSCPSENENDCVKKIPLSYKVIGKPQKILIEE